MTERFKTCCVAESANLFDALSAIDRSAIGIALIVDDKNHLLGTLTDGDIRRALLNGSSLQSPLAPHVSRDFVSVNPLADRAEVIELMQALEIYQVPIVEPEGKLVGLHLLREILGAIERPNWAVIMAGGVGSRLRPITENIPKPLIRVAGRPILERLILHLVGFGIRRVYLSVNYLGHMIQEYFGDGSQFGCQIEYLKETKPLGTGGALTLLPEIPKEPLLVMNGDLVTQANIAAMLDFHKQGGQLVTVGSREYLVNIPYGCLELQGDQVKQMQEKPWLSQTVNTGIYVLNSELLSRIPKQKEFPLPSLLEDCLTRGETIRAFHIEEDWLDVGQREHLKEAREGIG